MKLEKINITSIQKLVIDHETGTCFIEDDRYREIIHIYIPDLIKKLIDLTEKTNCNTEDFFWRNISC